MPQVDAQMLNDIACTAEPVAFRLYLNYLLTCAHEEDHTQVLAEIACAEMPGG